MDHFSTNHEHWNCYIDIQNVYFKIKNTPELSIF